MIYPKDQMIEQILLSAVDEETGEMLLTEEELQEKLAAVDMEFDDKIKYLRNSYMNDKINAECASAEASALYKMQQEASKKAKSFQDRADRTKRFIAWLLQGEKYEKDGVKISYMNRKETVIDDGFVDWAVHNAPGLLNEPTIKKLALNQALRSGSHVEFARLEDKKFVVVR